MLLVVLYKQTTEHTTCIFGNFRTFTSSRHHLFLFLALFHITSPHTMEPVPCPASRHRHTTWLVSRRLKHHRTLNPLHHQNASKRLKGKEDESTLGDAGNDTVKSQGQQNKGKGKGRKEMAKKGGTGSKQCVEVTELIAHMYGPTHSFFSPFFQQNGNTVCSRRCKSMLTV